LEPSFLKKVRMNKQDIFQRSMQSGKPIVIEFWATWCVPCRTMTPALEKTAHQFEESVELMRVNADEHPQALKDFGILGIPSIVVVSAGREITRHTGALNLSQLQVLFDAATNHQEILIPPSNGQRVLRIGAGLAIALIGNLWGPALPLYLIGAALIFSGLYDRCPIYKMLYPMIMAKIYPKIGKVSE